jgi:hypothetical protein
VESIRRRERVGLGSTTQLTDSAGAIRDSYSYDVFGAPRTVTGTTANDFRYTGKQRDGNGHGGLTRRKGEITKRSPR